MAKRSRPMGLSKSRKQQKTNSTNGSVDSKSQLTFEVADNEDPEDNIVQLKTLWNSYLQSNKESDAFLNGIVNECDTLLSNDKETLSNDPEFLSLFALALSELTVFNSDKVNEFFENAVDILKLAKDQENSLIKLVYSKIIFQRIPLQFIANLKVDSTDCSINLTEYLEQGKDNFNIINDKDSKTQQLTLEILQSMNDLLDIVENFGSNKNFAEGLDSDEDEEDELNIKLSSNHPLYEIKENINIHYQWLLDQLLSFFKLLDKDPNDDENPCNKLYYSVAKIIGELYLKKSEPFSNIFLSSRYDDDENELNEQEEKQCKSNQKLAQDNVQLAINFFKLAKDPNNPDSWAQLAEAVIDLGNLQDLESTEQEKLYHEAEDILQKANIASNNKYQYILDNLNSNNDDHDDK